MGNIISNYISVGGYSFESSEVFLKSYYDLKNHFFNFCIPVINVNMYN